MGAAMREWVIVSDLTWHAAMRECDPVQVPDKPYSPVNIDAASEYPPALVQAVIDFLSEDLGCDHSVNICCCGTAAVVAELRLNMQGQETCAGCGGDGFTWNKAKYEAAKAAFVAEHGAEWWDLEGEGYENCARCGGNGVTNQDSDAVGEQCEGVVL